MWRNPGSKSKEYCSLPTIFNVIVTTILQTYVCILVRKLLWKNELPGAELLYQTAAANLCCCWYFYSQHYWHNLYLIEDGHVTLFYSVHHVGVVIFFISPGHEGSKMCRTLDMVSAKTNNMNTRRLLQQHSSAKFYIDNVDVKSYRFRFADTVHEPLQDSEAPELSLFFWLQGKVPTQLLEEKSMMWQSYQCYCMVQ